MNVEKMEKLKRMILEEPRRYCQSFWLFGPESLVVKEQQPPCGTAGCLAGNACLMEGWKPAITATTIRSERGRIEYVTKGGETGLVSIVARQILDLTDEQAEILFDSETLGWTRTARQKFWGTDNPQERADAAAMQLDHMIRREASRQAAIG